MVSTTNIIVLLFLCELPLHQAIHFKTQEVIAGFEELPSSDLTFYKSLEWTSFSTTQTAHALYPIIPASPPTYAYSSITPTHDNGTMPGRDGRPATEITSIYAHSTVLFFDLKPFWFACLTPLLSPDSSTFEPYPCTLNISGYRAGSGKVIDSAVFDFEVSATSTTTVEEEDALGVEGVQKELAPMKTRSVAMARASPLWNTFNAVQRVRFDVGKGDEVGKDRDGGVETVVLVLDEVSYKTYNVTSWWGGVGVDSVVHEPGLYGVA